MSLVLLVFKVQRKSSNRYVVAMISVSYSLRMVSSIQVVMAKILSMA